MRTSGSASPVRVAVVLAAQKGVRSSTSREPAAQADLAAVCEGRYRVNR
jgi:hypothetical protein